MATVGGGSVAASVPDPDDDQSIGNDEYVWHVIEPHYYVDDLNNPGRKIILDASFAHGKSGVSFLRPKLGVDLALIRKYFPNAGISAMTAGDVRVKTRCLFVIENDPNEPWPTDAHICAYASPGKGRVRRGRLTDMVALAESCITVVPIT
jgi:hypothetical protein